MAGKQKAKPSLPMMVPAKGLGGGRGMAWPTRCAYPKLLVGPFYVLGWSYKMFSLPLSPRLPQILILIHLTVPAKSTKR